MRKYNTDNIIGFVNRHCPASDIVGIMLIGSYAEHTQSNNSDVDIIVVSMTASKQTHENIIEGGMMFQLIIFPYSKIASLIYEDYVKNRGVLFSMFNKGIIILDTKGVLHGIQKLLDRQAFPTNKEHEILRLRRRITNEMEYILGDSKVNKLCSTLEVVRETAHLITGQQAFVGKHLDRSMDMHKTELSLLNDALIAYLVNNDCTQFAATIQTLLKPFGGLLEKYTTDYLFNVPNDKYMLIFMPSCSIRVEAARKVVQYILRLCKSSFHCTVFYEGQNQMMEQGIYLFIYSENQSIINLCNVLNEVREKKFNSFKKDGIYLSYPHQSCFYEGGYFGGMEIFKTLIPLFSRLSKIFMNTYDLQKPIDLQSYQRIISMKVLYYFVFFAFEDVTRRKLFLIDCVHFFLPDAVDVNGIYNIKQLQGIKEQVLWLHDEMYDINNKNIHKTVLYDDQITSQMKTIVKDVCCAICKCISENDTPSQIMYATSEYALLIHILNHLLSICHLLPCEKFSLIYYLFKRSNEHDI